MLKVVLDTNMFLSGFLFHGMLKTVFDLMLDNRLQMFVSEVLVYETGINPDLELRQVLLLEIL